MISEVVMPALGATGGDVVLEEWFVEVGGFVRAGDPLFAVTTDKASVEVEAFRDGYVREQRVELGAKVEIGAVVAILADALDEPLVSTAPLPEEEVVPIPPPEAAVGGVQAERGAPAGRVLASPLARRIARSESIDLATVRGSGRAGQILKRDVLEAVEGKHRPPPTRPAPAGMAVRREPVSPMRRAIAARTHQSKADAPHFYAAITIDMTDARAFLEQAVDEAGGNGWNAPTMTDVIIRAAALALRRVPQINVSLQGDEVLHYDEVNIGLIVGLPEGMIVPVIRQADRKNLFSLATTTRRLKDGAVAGSLSSSDLGGSTFTISNLGMFGIDSFTAVINPPEAGILALGAITERPTVREGQVVARWQMTATLSVDHRVVDGISAARFLDELKQLLENPVRLALEPPEEPA